MPRTFPTRHLQPAVVAMALLLAGAFIPPPAWAAEDSSFLDTLSRWFASDEDEAGDSGSRNLTSGHVFQASQDIISEIELLREELGVYDFPIEAELVEDRGPIHAYVKALELLTKVGHVQLRFGMPVAEVRHVPFKEILPEDVVAILRDVLSELRVIKAEMVIDRQIEPATLTQGTTLSMVYKELADASALLDGLRGQPLTPDDVYLNCLSILDELGLIASKLSVSLEDVPPPVEGSKTPTEVAQQLLRATYKVIALQTRLGMEPSGVPNLTLIRVTPAENFDATSLLLAEMARIKHHLEVDALRAARNEPTGRRAEDVFALVLLLIQNVDRLAAAA